MATYRRVFGGQVAPGKHGEFLGAVQGVLDYQRQRGVAAQYSVWNSITGEANYVEVVSEFDSLLELEQFEEMVAQDQEFANMRSRVRQAMVFESADITLYRRMI